MTHMTHMTELTPALSPCPFCSSICLQLEHNNIPNSKGIPERVGYIRCLTCESCGPDVVATGNEDVQDYYNRVKTSWNKRAKRINK